MPALEDCTIFLIVVHQMREDLKYFSYCSMDGYTLRL